MRRTAAVLSIAVLALTAGCGSGGGEKADTPPTFDPSASPSESASASASPSATASAAVFDDKGHDIVVGTVKATNPKQKAVADAWIAYWRARGDAYGEAKADPAALGQVASGEPIANIVKYVAYLQENGLRTVGDSKLGISRIQVTPKAAVVVSCLENKSIDRHRDGRPGETLVPYYQFTGALVPNGGGGWLVTQAVKTSEARCTA